MTVSRTDVDRKEMLCWRRKSSRTRAISRHWQLDWQLLVGGQGVESDGALICKYLVLDDLKL
jgi:hypothetical protein